jgi:hypothetical protein
MDAEEISEGHARMNDALMADETGQNRVYAPVNAGMTHKKTNTLIYKGDTD